MRERNPPTADATRARKGGGGGGRKGGPKISSLSDARTGSGVALAGGTGGLL